MGFREVQHLRCLTNKNFELEVKMHKRDQIQVFLLNFLFVLLETEEYTDSLSLFSVTQTQRVSWSQNPNMFMPSNQAHVKEFVIKH